MAPTAAQNKEGNPGLFGPPVRVNEDAPLLELLIGLTGRDPSLVGERIGWLSPGIRRAG